MAWESTRKALGGIAERSLLALFSLYVDCSSLPDSGINLS